MKTVPLASKQQAVEGLLIYRFGSNLYFANENRFAEEIISLAKNTDSLKWFCISATNIGDVDFTSTETLKKVYTQLNKRRYLSAGPRGPRVGKFFPARQSDRVARVGAATGHAGGGPEPGIVPEKEGEGRRRWGAGADRCVHQFESRGAIFDRAGRAMSQRIDAELFVIYVDIGRDDNPKDQRSLEQNIQFAQNLGAQVVRTAGKKVAEEVAKVVREKHITQVVFGRSAQTGWTRYLYLSAIHKFLRDAPPVDVHIVTQEVK